MAVGTSLAKFQMAMSQQPVVLFTQCLVLVQGFQRPRSRWRYFLRSCWEILMDFTAMRYQVQKSKVKLGYIIVRSKA